MMDLNEEGWADTIAEMERMMRVKPKRELNIVIKGIYINSIGGIGSPSLRTLSNSNKPKAATTNQLEMAHSQPVSTNHTIFNSLRQQHKCSFFGSRER